jgi:DNA replication protein DnaC
MTTSPTPTITPDLKQVLKRLRLSGMLPTLPDRIALAKQSHMEYPAFLELVLSDEISRRDDGTLDRRLRAANFEELVTLEQWDDTAEVQYDRQLVQELFGLQFLRNHEHVLIAGQVGTGKSFLAQALGHAACRAGYSVLFVRVDTMLKQLATARVDYSFDRELHRFLAPDVLLADDFGLHKLSAQQSSDLYDVIIGRHRTSSVIVTSNRDVSEWLALFDDPILANSALDRLTHNSYQLVMEGESYRKRTSPHARRAQAANKDAQ